jgi:hypothetical protein
MGEAPTIVFVASTRKWLERRQPIPNENHPPLCHPERTRVSYFTALTGAIYMVLRKENHMHLTGAATLDRKSGGADGICSFPQPQTESHALYQGTTLVGP